MRRLEQLEDLGDGLASVVQVLALLACAPGVMISRLRYRKAGRTDWDVLVFAGDAAPDDPAECSKWTRSCADRQSAADHADAVLKHLDTHGQLPQPDQATSG